MADIWDRRIYRAEQLAAIGGPAVSLLTFYGRLLRSQKVVYRSLNADSFSGVIEHDAARLAERGSALLRDVVEYGPPALSADARRLIDSGSGSTESLLRNYWTNRSDCDFFAKALVQPYGQWLTDHGIAIAAPDAERIANRCPSCGGAPQLSILEASAPEAGGSRLLQCATCLATWPFPRVVCPSCGEQDERQLGYFHTSAFDHVRLDACQRCRCYLKTIDLGCLGLADPLVDEIAAAPLDAWAREHDYHKIELNLVGL